MSYIVSVREVPAMNAMTFRFVTNMGAIAQDMPKAYKQLHEYLENNGAKFTGNCFAIYHGEGFNPDLIDVECGFSVEKLLPEFGTIRARQIEGGLMASALHKGAYEKLEGAYYAIMEWVKGNGYQILPGVRDMYLNGPDCEGVKSPDDFLTEVLWPVVKIS